MVWRGFRSRCALACHAGLSPQGFRDRTHNVTQPCPGYAGVWIMGHWPCSVSGDGCPASWKLLGKQGVGCGVRVVNSGELVSSGWLLWAGGIRLNRRNIQNSVQFKDPRINKPSNTRSRDESIPVTCPLRISFGSLPLSISQGSAVAVCGSGGILIRCGSAMGKYKL